MTGDKTDNKNDDKIGGRAGDGLQRAKPPISSVVKWLAIGFLGTVAMILIFIGVLVFKFTPLFHVDDLNGKVTLLGGLVQVEGANGRLFLNSSRSQSSDLTENSFDGSIPVADKKKVIVKFSNGAFEISTSEDSQFLWDCRAGGFRSTLNPTINSERVSLDLRGLLWTKCQLHVPKNAEFLIEGSNGKFEFEKPFFNITADLANGSISILPDSDQKYRYDLSVANGKVDSFVSSNRPEAFSITIRLKNGRIIREK